MGSKALERVMNIRTKICFCVCACGHVCECVCDCTGLFFSHHGLKSSGCLYSNSVSCSYGINSHLLNTYGVPGPVLCSLHGTSVLFVPAIL